MVISILKERSRARRGRNTRRLVAQAQEKFYACETCMPTGDLAYIEDLLKGARLNQLELSRIDRDLDCPGCGARVTLFDRVVPCDEHSVANERKFKKWINGYALEYESFRKFLDDYPQLGSKHSFGRKLAEAVRRAPVTTLEPSTWYRVVNGTQPFDDNKFFAPQASRLGRYNREGQTAFYVADSSKTAALELLKERKLESGVPMHVATLVFRRHIRIIDLTVPFPGTRLSHPIAVSGLVLSGEIRRKEPVPEEDYRAYRVPQFLADLVREKRVGGLLYTSCREYPYRTDVFGTCLAIFDSDFRNLCHLQDVRQFQWQACTICPPFNLPDMDFVSAEGPDKDQKQGEHSTRLS